jgi:hypothetical protein
MRLAVNATTVMQLRLLKRVRRSDSASGIATKTQLGFANVSTISAKKPDDGSVESKQIVRKMIAVLPADEELFLKAMTLR